MRTFIAVVEAGSFTAAGKRLGISNKLVSKYIAELEMRVDANLLHRTTRSLSITNEGRNYLAGCRRVLGEVDALDEAMNREGKLKGKLRVAAPITFGDTFVASAATKFIDAHPEVTIEIELSDMYADLAEGGYDLAVRIGELQNSSLIARKIGETEVVVVAAPSYLKENGTPVHPDELTAHTCIRDANNPNPDRWPFFVEGQNVQIPVSGPYMANSPPACLLPTYAGKGIFICPDVFLGNDLETGRLVRLLSGFPSRTIPIQAVQLPSTFRNLKVTAFVESMQVELKP